MSPAFLRGAARDAGLSEAQVAQLEDARFEARIERNRKLAQALHAEYSLTVFLNGVRLDGWISEKQLTDKLSVSRSDAVCHAAVGSCAEPLNPQLAPSCPD